jgi:hypothetical protein
VRLVADGVRKLPHGWLSRHLLPSHVVCQVPLAAQVFTGADVAQQVEQLICNQQVASSSLAIGSKREFGVRRSSEVSRSFDGVQAEIGDDWERYPSGQREQTVNLPALAYGGSNPPLSTTRRGLHRPRPSDGAKVAATSLVSLEFRTARRSLAAKCLGFAGVAQLVRASAFQAEGREFESRLPLSLPRFTAGVGNAPEGAD